MAIDEQKVERVARLAQLRLAPGEAATLAAEIGHILDWVDQLQAVDTEGVEPMTAVIPAERPWRADEVTDGDMADEVLANAPQAAHGFFAVPKVIE